MTEEDFRDKHKNDKLPEELKILIAKAAETGLKILKDYENEFNKILDSYQDYCRVNGLIVPKNTDEFFTWISLRYPYESLPVIIEAAKNPFNYKLFHDYKERLFKNPEWNDKKEMEFLQQHFNTPAQIQLSECAMLITQKFNDMHDKGWAYAFLSESDFNSYVQLLTNFFEYKPQINSADEIKLKRNTKTRVATILRDIHKDLSEKELINDKPFFNLVRILNHFKHDSEKDLYKALTR